MVPAAAMPEARHSFDPHPTASRPAVPIRSRRPAIGSKIDEDEPPLAHPNPAPALDTRRARPFRPRRPAHSENDRRRPCGSMHAIPESQPISAHILHRLGVLPFDGWPSPPSPLLESYSDPNAEPLPRPLTPPPRDRAASTPENGRRSDQCATARELLGPSAHRRERPRPPSRSGERLPW